jgi:acetate kinase
MRVLVLNAGSSSLKWAILDSRTEETLAGGEEPRAADFDRQMAACIAKASAVDGRGAVARPVDGRGSVARPVDGRGSVARPVDAVGHRVVHAGSAIRAAVRIDDAVRLDLGAAAELDPLHAPVALAAIDAARAALPGVPQVAALDTAFHATIPEPAARYALPAELGDRRKLGFHGLSVAWSVRRARELLGRAPGRLVVCHIGSGSSLTAVANGRSIDTTMGMTPLDGVMMATRSGALDPGLVLYLVRRSGMGAEDVERALSERAGLYGVSGISGDLREVLASMDRGDARARLAYDMLVYSLCRNVGAMVAALEGLDAIAFTGGAGEGSARLRADVCARLGWAGVRLDPASNESKGDRVIGSGAATALLIRAREDLSILAEVVRVLGGST